MFKVVTTLLRAEFSAAESGLESLYVLANFLERQLAGPKGVVASSGLSSLICEARASPDHWTIAKPTPRCDDTAKTALYLNILGRSVSSEAMICTFKCKNDFKTYDAERTSSLSANCNVLIAIVGLLWSDHVETWRSPGAYFSLIHYLHCFWEQSRGSTATRGWFTSTTGLGEAARFTQTRYA